MIVTQIDPFDDPELCAFVQKVAQPYIHRGMTMREWLQINALIYEIVEKLLPSYLDNIAMLHRLQKELEDVALHRYLITPFGKRTAVWK